MIPLVKVLASEPIATNVIYLHRPDDGQKGDQVVPEIIQHDQCDEGKHAQADGPI